MFLPIPKYHWSKAMLHLLPDIGCSPMAVLFACDRLLHKHFVRSLFGCVFFIPFFLSFIHFFVYHRFPVRTRSVPTLETRNWTFDRFPKTINPLCFVLSCMMVWICSLQLKSHDLTHIPLKSFHSVSGRFQFHFFLRFSFSVRLQRHIYCAIWLCFVFRFICCDRQLLSTFQHRKIAAILFVTISFPGLFFSFHFYFRDFSLVFF